MANRRMVRTGPKPRYVWVPGFDLNNALAGSARVTTGDLLAVYLTDSSRDTGPGMVIERILGSISIASQVVNSGGQFTLGLSVANEGSWGSVPSPSLEIHDWIVWLSGDYSQNAQEGAIGIFTPKLKTYNFDVRSRRRLRAIGDEVIGVIENLDETLVIYSIQTRILMRVT